jgi:Kef-type K+ transport system membrane component KefB
MLSGHLAVLAAVSLVAYFVGELLARFRVPRLPVYLAVGALASVLITSVRETADLTYPVINPMALCVIGFIAGSHLVWKTIKPRVRPISLQIVGMSLGVSAIVGVFVFAILANRIPPAASLAAAVLAGTVMLALSPPEAIAIISESRAAGPFTRLVLGATVVMDVVVVSAFSVSLTLAKSLLGDSGSGASLGATVAAGLAIAVVGGLIVGVLLQQLVERVESNVAVSIVLVLLAGLAAVLAIFGKQWADDVLGLPVEIEPLLVAMVAGLFVANRSAAYERFAEILERLAPYVYVVFFTMTGLGLHVETLIDAAGPAALLWILRIGGLWVGSTAAMAIAKEPPIVRKVAWRAFVPQAGIALALASTIAVEFPEGGALLASVIIGTVVLNEATGPFFLQSALRATGETVPEGEVLD